MQCHELSYYIARKERTAFGGGGNGCTSPHVVMDWRNTRVFRHCRGVHAFVSPDFIHCFVTRRFPQHPTHKLELVGWRTVGTCRRHCDSLACNVTDLDCMMSALANKRRSHWRRCLQLLIAFIFVPLLYVVGYFVVMNRHLPTSPFRNDAHYFDSSYRWAKKQNSQKGGPPDMPWPNPTGWNDLYQPLDSIYFRLFPRSDAEVRRLKEMGWRG